jgi:hypothetical protein
MRQLRFLFVGTLLFAAACANEARDTPEDAAVADAAGDTSDAAVDVDDRDVVPPGDVVIPPDVSADAPMGLPEPDNHRPAETVCDDERAPSTDLPPPDSGDWPCYQDSDCTDGANGRCRAEPRFGWACSYDGCTTDDDCGGLVCACGGAWGNDANVCRRGNCAVDADCGDGGWCSPSFDDCGEYSGVVAYYCRTAADTCLNDSDCTEMPGGYCMFSVEQSHWLCSYSQCVGK